MGSVRRKTRGQWDEYFKIQHSVLKRKNDEESGGNGGAAKRVQNENRNGRESVECSRSSRSSKRVEEEEKYHILASEKTRKLDSDVFLDEQADSSLKSGSESGSGSGTEVDNSDEVVSEQVFSGSGTKKQVHTVDLENSTDSGNSMESSDESESESTSEEDYELSDEDYKVSETSASESSEEDDNGGENGRRESGTDPEKENQSDEDSNRGSDLEKKFPGDSKKRSEVRLDYDDEGYHEGSGQSKDEDVIITIDEGFLSNGKKNHKGNGNFGLEEDSDKEEVNLEKYFQSNKISKSKESEPKLGKYDSADNEYKSSRYDDGYHFDGMVKRGKQWLDYKVKHDKNKSRSAMKIDMIKILVDSINAEKDPQFNFKRNGLPQNALPSRFRFEDEVVPPKEKSQWEEEVDSFFLDLELGLRESEMDCSSFSEVENDRLKPTENNESPAARCGRGEHLAILEEEIGIVCKYCHAVILDIKYVLPPFYTPPSARGDKMDCEELLSSFTGPIQFPDSIGKNPDSTNHIRGTVWDLIPGVKMFTHQCEGFEFIWKNIAGDIVIEKLKETLPNGRGCIISHAPGTGKTRLTIVFLQTFLKLYPSCCPIIIAPRGMLLTWEAELIKWEFDFPFHNLNNKDLSGNENAIASQIFGQVGAGILSMEVVRLLKLYSWTKGGGILGISYNLFERLAGENVKEGLHQKIREVLLQRPGLLVLDEGHTPRNDKSLLWKALSNVATQRRIILSGTPFQNNLKELYNTLCLVNPKFVNQIGLGNETRSYKKKDGVARKRWKALTSSIGKNKDDGLRKLRAMLDPFVHVHNGNILEENLPGLRHTLVFLHPAEYQKTLLETSSKVKNIFHRIRLVSLVSVHPSLNTEKPSRSIDKSKLEEIESDVDAGVKMKFLMKLIWLADALGERVLVFSQFIDPLVFIKKQLESHYFWNEGREVLYMDGQLEEKQRQDSITSFNDDTSEAKVLLASERACSEGINLVGASRVVLLDTVWNPSVEKQAISRAYRLGQKKVVHVYRLFTSGIEVRQFAQQIRKVQLSELIFSLGSGKASQRENSPLVLEDKLLDSMLDLERFNGIFEKIICQPKESELFQIFGLAKQK